MPVALNQDAVRVGDGYLPFLGHSLITELDGEGLAVRLDASLDRDLFAIERELQQVERLRRRSVQLADRLEVPGGE